MHYMTSYDKNYIICCDCNIVGVNETVKMWERNETLFLG